MLQEGKRNYLSLLWSRFARRHNRRTIRKGSKAEGAGQGTSIDAKKTGPTSVNAALDPKEQTDSTVGRQPDADNDDIKAEMAEHDTTAENRDSFPSHLTSSAPKISIDKPMSPPLTLPGDDEVKQSVEENASTRALFHAPMTSQISLAASNRPTSNTVRSQSDDASTTGDKESATVTSGGPDRWDDASTRAIVNARGVVGVVDRPNTGSTRSHAFEPSNAETGSMQ